MAVGINISPITTLDRLSKINSNFDRIEEALQDAVSRSGNTPNSMSADLDMDSNDLLNVGLIAAEDITVDGGSVTGVLERAETAATEAEVSATAADISEAAAAASAAAAAVSATSASANAPVATRTILKAIVPVVGMAVYLTESGRSGRFIWRTGDYSTQITADTREAIYLKADTVATTSGAWVREHTGAADIRWWGAIGDGTTDDLLALQAAADWREPVRFPPLVFATSSAITFSDGTRWIGAGGNFVSRTGYTAATDGTCTEIKYIGAGGSNSTVVRASQMGVGVEGNDFTAPSTSDLRNVTFTGFHVNANNLADIGLYCYRLGLGTVIDDISSEKAKKVCTLILGSYAAYYGRLGTFHGEEHGFMVGHDYFGWGSVEAECYAFNADLYTARNGTAGTFVKNDATHDTDGSGGIFRLGRGSRVTITSENNDGRSMIIKTKRWDFTDGPVFYNIQYQEGNGAGFRVEYDNKTTRHIISGGFVNTDQDIRVVAQVNGVTTDDSGPSDQNRWLELRDMFGSDASNGFVVNSNTTMFSMNHCTSNAQFSNRSPARYNDIISSTVASGSAVALTSGASADVTSITLKPGTWDVTGTVGYAPAASTNVTRFIQSISPTSATTDGTTGNALTADIFVGGVVMGMSVQSYRRSVGPVRVTVVADTPYYLVSNATFTISTMGAFGHISAKRVY